MENEEIIKKTNSHNGLIKILYIVIVISISVISFVVGQNWEVFNKVFRSSKIFEKSYLTNDGVKGIDNLYQTYKTNDLIIDYFSYYAEPISEEYSTIDMEQDSAGEFDPSDYRITANYFKIYGLKNKDIENKINKRIKQYMLEQISFAQKYEYEHVDVWVNECGNFSNILSVNVYVGVQFYGDNYKNFPHGITFDLNTGNEIKFTDVFTYDADIENILSDCAYQTLGRDYLLNGYLDMDEIDYEELEDDVDRVIKKYEKNPDIEFSVTPSEVIAIIGNQSVDIPMFNYREQIAIYNRFLSNAKLFELSNDEKGKVNVFLQETDVDYSYTDVERISDNLFVSVQIDKKYYDMEELQDVVNIKEEDYQEIFDYVQEKIEEYKQKNDGKGRFYEIMAYSYSPNSDVKYNIEETCFEADLAYCEETFFPWIVKNMSIGIPVTYLYEEELDDEMKDYIDIQKNEVSREEDYYQYSAEDEEYYDGI